MVASRARWTAIIGAIEESGAIPQWASRMPAPSADELELLEYAYERRPTSRLSCQIFLTEQLQGLCMEIPIRQT